MNLSYGCDNSGGIAVVDNPNYYGVNGGANAPTTWGDNVATATLIYMRSNQSANSVQRINVDNSADRLVLDGQAALSNGANTVKSGPGTLELAGSTVNVQTQTMYVNGGTLVLNKTNNVMALPGGGLQIGDDFGGDSYATAVYGSAATPNQVFTTVNLYIRSSGKFDWRRRPADPQLSRRRNSFNSYLYDGLASSGHLAIDGGMLIRAPWSGVMQIGDEPMSYTAANSQGLSFSGASTADITSQQHRSHHGAGRVCRPAHRRQLADQLQRSDHWHAGSQRRRQRGAERLERPGLLSGAPVSVTTVEQRLHLRHHL